MIFPRKKPTLTQMMKSILPRYIAMVVMAYSSVVSAFSQAGPQPGDIYREYAVNLRSGNNWRVTHPGATHPGAAEFLPNPVLSIRIDDLDKAVRAEVLMDIWGGHAGTTGRKFRFNENPWMEIPRPPTLVSKSECYLSQYNVILELPMEYLHEGENSFEGTSGGQVCNDFGWGQWGWYVMMVRIYYSQDKTHTAGKIISPSPGDTLTDNPVIVCEPDDRASVSQVQFLGRYLGYDENGDGIYHDWHRAYHGPEVEGHLGTASGAPFEVQWNTRYVPDQEPRSVSLMARIRDSTGTWYVTGTVDSLSLGRMDSVSVKMIPSYGVPTNFVVRAGNYKECWIRVDSLDDIMEARLFHRTWNGGDDEAAGGTIDRPLGVNGSLYRCGGKNHFFALSNRPIAVSGLRQGRNDIRYTSTTVHHGIEVLWPGPALILRYVRGGEQVADPVFTPPDSTLFTGVLIPSIQSATEGATIYYTTNRRDPNHDDIRFRPGLIRVERDMVIKAKAFKHDYFESEVVTARYLVDHTGSDTETAGGLILYPNPAGNWITLVLPPEYLEGDFSINDFSGRVVLSGKVTEGVIGTGSLESGIFLLRYRSGNREYSGRVVIGG